MGSINSPVPILGFAANSGTGKTTLLKKLIPVLRQQGIRPGVIKHAHHDFDIDHPGKDSYELRKAGASKMLVASGKRWALMSENEPEDQEPDLQTLIHMLDPITVDLILVEGFKKVNFPKIELHRSNINSKWIYPDDQSIIALATDETPPELPVAIKPVILNINDPLEIASFIIKTFLDR